MPSSVNSFAVSVGPFLGGGPAGTLGLRAVFPVSAHFLVVMFARIGRTADAGEARPTRARADT